MPINISEKLPAYQILEGENIGIIGETLAAKQDIRPLEVAILNLMPTKVETETQLLRLLSNTPLQLNPQFIKFSSYESKHDKLHIESFYKTFSEINRRKFDALIITGAPLETYEFEDVKYWKELTEIMEWSTTNVFSTLHICWGAQAGLYYHYGLPKRLLPEKLSGIFPHHVLDIKNPLLKGFDEVFLMPHSRNAETPYDLTANAAELSVIADSDECGPSIITAKNGRQIFISGHIEYDKNTLKTEYERDLAKGINPRIPKNYFPNDNPALEPKKIWSAHASLFYYNWLNFIYQETTYDINSIPPLKGN